jgi:hypothetical protein
VPSNNEIIADQNLLTSNPIMNKKKMMENLKGINEDKLEEDKLKTF